ncbi:hypothetical protein [Photobacterium carnosum]|uniref:hypothetical protein n=1 Tax=Photobacterium carnosum TaxID=2023717 RepID=UPI001E5E14B8|nr:hypothetical protein [Photobacterium carnosum]MCD9515528.1 hypothetical protein [Photobacterium carnosum]
MANLSVVSNKIEFKEVIFCGNRIYETGKLIIFKEIEVIVLANGIKPRIWLSVFLENGDNFYIVEDSKPKHDSVNIDLKVNSIVIKFDSEIVFRGRKTSCDKFEVDLCDLRGVGLDVYGDEHVLMVGGMSLSRSTVKNCGCLISLN